MTLKTLILPALPLLILGYGGCTKKQVAVSTPPAPVSAAPAPAPRAPETARTVDQPAETAAPAPSRLPDAATRARIQELLDRIQDVYFDYGEHNLRPDAVAAIEKDAKTLSEIMRQYPDFRLTVEGYCDERGSSAYNLALGDARAKKAAEYLVMLGLPGGQLKELSYGKEKPVCTEHTEACWQKNRRAHITQASSS
jgi:peptidoglycan-associated lipoprotein